MDAVPDAVARPTGAPELDDRTRRWAYTGVLVTLFLASTNLTVVGTALPRIIAELDGFALYAWAFTGFTLASTVSTPIYGRLSDTVGRKRVLMFGVVLFSLASVAAGFSVTMGQLVALRVVQGLGGGALMSMAFAVIADVFPPRQRGKYQGLSGIVWGASSVVGPVIGGLITDLLGWRWVFFVNVPVALLALAVLHRHLPAGERRPGAAIDLPGAALLTVGMLATMLAFSWSGDGLAWSDARVWATLLLGVAAMLAFAAWQARSPAPVLPPELLRERTVAIANAAGFLLGVGLFGATIYLPLYIQGVAGLSAAASGFALTPLILGMILSGSLSGIWSSRIGRYRRFVVVGLTVAVVGFALGTTMGPDTPISFIVGAMFLLGLGLGPTNAMFLVAVQATAAPHLLGTATSAHQFFRQVGGTLGVALFGALMAQQAALTFANDVAPLVAGLPAAAVATVASPDLLTDPAAAAAAEAAVRPRIGAAAFAAVVEAWRAGLGRGITLVFQVSGALATLAWIATWWAPPLRLADRDADGDHPGAASGPQPPI
jgi:EmrB/QacA subfamily drug resistance transporter